MRRVAWLSLANAAVLAALKLAGWALSGSVGLLGALADSGLDLLAAAGTLTAVRLAATPPDAEHSYGHGKAEAFAALLQAALVFASAVLIGMAAVAHLLRPEPVRAVGPALGVAAVSTLLAAALVAAQTRVLAQARSVAVEGDRTHYLADVACNIAAFAGLAAAALLHAPQADAGAGLLIAAILVGGAVRALKGAADSLMDRELDGAERGEIAALMMEDARVLGVRDLRTRASGPIVHVQAHLGLEPSLSIETAHQILVEVEARVLARFPSADILLQPDPEGRAAPHTGAFAAAVRARESAAPPPLPAARR